MVALAGDIRSVLWLAVVPALLSVALIVFFVEEPARKASESARVSLRSAIALGRQYWTIVGLGAVLTLARFSEAFLVLRAQGLGLAIALVPVVLVVMNLVYTAVAYPAGVAADHGHRRALLIGGLAALIASDIVMAAADRLPALFAGIALWGVHMGLTQGLLSTLVADAAPAALRGTAFGAFHLVSGVALFAASVLAGSLWTAFGPAAAFYAGAAFSAIALAGLIAVTRRR